MEVKIKKTDAVLNPKCLLITKKMRTNENKFRTKLKYAMDSNDFCINKGIARRKYKKGPGSLPPSFNSGPANGI